MRATDIFRRDHNIIRRALVSLDRALLMQTPTWAIVARNVATYLDVELREEGKERCGGPLPGRSEPSQVPADEAPAALGAQGGEPDPRAVQPVPEYEGLPGEGGHDTPTYSGPTASSDWATCRSTSPP